MSPRLILSLCLVLFLLEGSRSQLKFRPRFSSLPNKDSNLVSASSFGDQASKFRRVFFQRQKPTLLKTGGSEEVAEYPKAEQSTTTPVAVSTKATTASAAVIDSVSPPSTTSSNHQATSTELPKPLNSSSKPEVKDDFKSLRRKLFQRPRFSVLSSISRESNTLRTPPSSPSTVKSTTTTLGTSIASTVSLTTARGTTTDGVTLKRSEISSTSKTLPVEPEVILGESYEERVTSALEMMEDIYLDTVQHDKDEERDLQHVPRKSLFGRLRPLVVEILSSPESSRLTLDERVEKLRNVLMKESPETVRSNFESSSFNFHARNLFLKLQNSSLKMTEFSKLSNAGDEGEAEKEELPKASSSEDSKENNLRLSFKNLRNWHLTPETTTTAYSVIDLTDVRGRLQFPKAIPLSTRSTATTEPPTRTTTEMGKVRRVVFSSLSYPTLPDRGLLLN